MNYSPLPSLVLNLVLTLAANLKKPANRAKAQAKRAEGYIVCGEFGLSKGETVELIDTKGKLLSKK